MRGLPAFTPPPGVGAELPEPGERWGSGGLKGDPPATFYGAMPSIPSGTSVFLTLALERGKTYMLEDFEAGIRAKIRPT